MKTGTPSFLIDKHYSPYIIAGSAPWWTYTADHGGVSFEIDGRLNKVFGDILHEFKYILNNYLYSGTLKDAIAVGYFSYDLKDVIEGRMKDPHFQPQIPLVYFACYNKIKKYNINDILQRKSIKNFKFSSPTLTLRNMITFEEYRSKILRIKRYIEDGEVYQVNLSHPLEFSFSGDPEQLYLKLREIAQPFWGAYLDIGNIKVLSLSPERFFKVKGNTIESFPIKGTMQSYEDRKRDLITRARLRASEKDRAEHIMIVDLLRNDLGRICQPGSIGVDPLFQIKTFRTVHHMVSRIYGRLRKGVEIDEIIRAIFPGGSVTGAPKIRAMEIIEEIEGYRRGIYTGSIGYIMPDRSMDFNIAIRTLIIQGSSARYSTGGGIVYDSDPTEEYRETLVKSKILEEVTGELKNEEGVLPERKVSFSR